MLRRRRSWWPKLLNLNEAKVAKQLSDAKEDERRFVPIAKGLDAQTADHVNKELEDPKIQVGYAEIQRSALARGAGTAISVQDARGTCDRIQ